MAKRTTLKRQEQAGRPKFDIQPRPEMLPKYIQEVPNEDYQHKLYMIHLINNLMSQPEAIMMFSNAFGVSKQDAHLIYRATCHELYKTQKNQDPEIAKAHLEAHILNGLRVCLETKDMGSYAKLVNTLKDVYGVASQKNINIGKSNQLTAEMIFGSAFIDAVKVEDTEKTPPRQLSEPPEAEDSDPD